MLDLVVVLIAVVIVSTLGLAVYLRDEKGAVGRSFFIVTIAIITWSIANYFADHASDLLLNTLLTRLTFAAGSWILMSLLAFSFCFPIARLKRSKLYAILFALAGATIFSMSSAVVSGVTKIDSGVDILPGELYVAYLVGITSLLLLTLYNFYKSYKISNPLQRNQIRFIALSIGASVLAAVLMNLVLPVVLQDWTISRYGPLATIIFVGTVAYAIIRYRFLNIRLIIARSIGYLLLLGTLGTGYSLALFGISRAFLNDQAAPLGQQLTYLALAILIAITFRPLRRFFDKITQAVFYRDAYETQKILDAISTILVNSGSVNALIENVAKHTNQALRARFIQVVILQEVGIRSFSLGEDESVMTESIAQLAAKINQPIIVLDEVDGHTKTLYSALRRKSVAAILRLQSGDDLIGFILLGSKQTGGMYTAQDINLIRIIADELSIAVQNALRFEKIERFNETLQKKIDDATAELRQSNKKLRALDEAKDEFISMASHQLRTPLTSVKGYLSMALEGDAGRLNRDQHRLLDEAYSSTQRMVYMIADLLNVSRLKTGKFVLEPSAVSLPQVIREELEQLGPAAKARGLHISTHIPAQFPKIYVDDNKIRQVIMNFIDNAIFYSRTGGTITISLDKTANSIACTVQDQGIGVPVAEQRHLFTKFFRASNAKQARPDGTGIGLFMARKVIDAHGGQMIIASEENKGSTFGFRLPLQLAPEAKAK